jgi:hypothetical protein
MDERTYLCDALGGHVGVFGGCCLMGVEAAMTMVGQEAAGRQ